MSLTAPTWIRQMHASAKARASITKMPFQLTHQDVVDLWGQQDGQCYWFGVPMMFPMEDEDILRSPFLPTLDRVDSTRGYVPGNVVFACWAANAAKGSCPPEEWERFLGYLRDGIRSQQASTGPAFPKP